MVSVTISMPAGWPVVGSALFSAVVKSASPFSASRHKSVASLGVSRTFTGAALARTARAEAGDSGEVGGGGNGHTPTPCGAASIDACGSNGHPPWRWARYSSRKYLMEEMIG